MTRLTVTLSAALLFSAHASYAATVRTDFTDADFVAVCSDGSFNEACEVAVAEIRAGNAQANGSQEVTIREPDPTQGGGFAGNDAQRALPSGTPLGLSVTFDALAQTFDMDLGGASPVALTNVDFSTVRSLLIRNSSRGGGSLSLSNLALNGAVLGDIDVAGVSYMMIGDFDFSNSFTLTGDATFTFGPGDKLGSNLAAQFKFVDIDLVAPVPLPASFLLLAGGLGALAAGRRRAL